MISDDDRIILLEAKELERRRVEISEYAINHRIVDLLPDPWASLLEFEDVRSKPVEISLMCGLNPEDATLMTDRECRDFVRFVADIAQGARIDKKMREEEQDDGA